MQLSAIVTKTHQFKELKHNQTVISTRIMQLAPFSQDHNGVTNSPPGNIVKILKEKFLGAGIFTRTL